ncbi:MAG: hypothetical protein JOZ13_00230 [Alphaproteobacteria bacterium]|nr:hypothetical protein [Alphaproteobacteria bacterium]
MALINPAAHEPIGTSLSGADAGPPTTSFADLLDGHEQQKPHAPRSHRAYSFAELGMFGLHKFLLTPQQQAEAKQTAPMAKIEAPTAASGTATGLTAAGRTTQQPPVPLVYVPAIEVADRPAAPAFQNAGTGSRVSQSPMGQLASQNRSSDTKAPMLDRSATAKAADLKATPDALIAMRKGRDAISLSVSGPDEALAIVLRSDGAGMQEVTRLRQLIETTVAHFEMDIAQLHVNGAAVGTVFSLGGGANGGGAR